MNHNADGSVAIGAPNSEMRRLSSLRFHAYRVLSPKGVLLVIVYAEDLADAEEKAQAYSVVFGPVKVEKA